MTPDTLMDQTIQDAIKNNEFGLSIRKSTALLVDEPSNPKGYTYLGITHSKLSEKPNALHNFRKAYLTRTDENGSTGRNLWKSYFETGQVSSALNLLQELKENSERKLELFTSCISIAVELKIAKQIFNNSYYINNFREFPENVQAFLAATCIAEGLTGELSQLIDHMLTRKDQNFFFATKIKGDLVSSGLSETTNPIRALKNALLVDPSGVPLAQKLGQMYFEAEKPTKSIRWQIIGFLLNPSDTSHAIITAKKCMEHKVWQYGIPILKTLHKLHPDDESVLEGMVKLYEAGIPNRASLKEDAISIAFDVLKRSNCENPRIDDNALTLLRLAEHFTDTEQYWARMMEKHPSLHVVHHNCGYFYSEAKQFERSLISSKRSALLQPDYARVWNLIGLVYGHLFQPSKGVVNCGRAILMAKQDGYYMNQGVFYRSMGDFANSTRAFKKGEALKQKHQNELTYSIGINQIMLGEIGEGFRRYEARWGIPSFTSPKRKFKQKIWKGPEAMPGVDLLVWLEQGMGDEIMFSPYVNDLKKDVSRLVVECDERLVEIFERTYDGVEFIPRVMTDEQLDVVKELEYKIPIGHIPQYYVERLKDKLFDLYRKETRAGTPQPSVLKLDEEKLVKWKSRLDEVFGDKLVCGVSWASSFKNYTREQQYIGLEDLANALGGGGNIGVINLQYSYDSDEAAHLKELGKEFGYDFYTPEDIDLKDDLDDVLTILRLCDMSVTPMISLAWMTGAVGTPSYIFRTAPEGRIWQQLGSPVMPWYPSMKLFFRHPSEDWTKVSNQIAEQMRLHCASAERPRRLEIELNRSNGV